MMEETPLKEAPVRVVIDGCNILHVEGVLPAEVAGVDLDGLAALTLASRHRHDSIVIVMDGPRRSAGADRGGVRVLFSGAGRTADSVIIEMVKRDSAPRQTLVVSSDREILRAARRRKCRTMTSEAFLARLGADYATAAPHRPAPPPGERVLSTSTEMWIEAFGVTEADLTLPPEAVPDEPVKPAVADVGEVATPPPSPTAETASAGDERERPPRRMRPLEGARSLEEIDLDELERFDMGAWLDEGESPQSSG